MRQVLDLVATEERPLVVFVDDLDRCSPGTVAQVIEAINLFLAASSRTACSYWPWNLRWSSRTWRPPIRS
ncbi:P-loop NTPase fold protein [Streptosporangium lutulentum]